MKTFRNLAFWLLAILLVCPLTISAQSSIAARGHNSTEPAATPDCGASSTDSRTIQDAQAGHGFDLANLDRSVSPCDNFFEFADGGWIKAHPIPAAYATWGTFNILHEHNEDVLHDIL